MCTPSIRESSSGVISKNLSEIIFKTKTHFPAWFRNVFHSARRKFSLMRSSVIGLVSDYVIQRAWR
jgi:hypothetical protein